MGQGNSKGTEKSPNEMNDTDKYIEDVVANLKGSIDSLNKNDIKSLKQTVTSMPASKKLSPGMVSYIVKIIQNTETALDLDKNRPNLSSNTQLQSYLASISKANIEGIKENLMKENMKFDHPILKKGMDDIFGPVATIHAKYKYFMYKYIQVNIFLILFANQVQEVMNYQFSKIIEYQKLQAEKDQELIQNMIAMMSEIAKMDNSKIDDNMQREDIEKLSKDAMEAANARISNLEQFVDRMKKQSYEDIIKMFVESQEELVKEVESIRRS